MAQVISQRVAKKLFLSLYDMWDCGAAPEESWVEMTAIKPGATEVTQELKGEVSGEVQDNCGLQPGRRKSLRRLLITGREFPRPIPEASTRFLGEGVLFFPGP